LKYNVARSLISLGRHADAVADLEAVVAHQPQRLEAAFKLADCYQALGQNEKCKVLIDRIATDEFDDRAIESRTSHIKPQLDYMYGILELNTGNHEQALDRFIRAEQSMGDRLSRDFHKNLGNAFLRLEKWDDCKRAFEKALLAEPDDPASLHGLAIVSLNEERFEDATEFALQSLQVLFQQPRAHFHLGLACWKMGDLERAQQAFQTSLTMRPQAEDVHQKLNELNRAINAQTRD